MTNAEKYKGAKERVEAFRHDNDITNAAELLNIRQVFNWLELEAPAEKPLPCPFCGATHSFRCEANNVGNWYLKCCACGYRTKTCGSENGAIEIHNRIAIAAKEKEANDAN